MGSGKGRIRRTRATTTAAEVRFGAQVWGAFVKGQGLHNVKLADYYQITLDTAQADDTKTKQAQADLAQELFRDLVATDALRLPQGVRVDDFDFLVDKRQYGSWSSYKAMCLVMRRGQKEETVLTYPGKHFNERTKFGNYGLHRVLRGISATTNRLIKNK